MQDRKSSSCPPLLNIIPSLPNRCTCSTVHAAHQSTRETKLVVVPAFVVGVSVANILEFQKDPKTREVAKGSIKRQAMETPQADPPSSRELPELRGSPDEPNYFSVAVEIPIWGGKFSRQKRENSTPSSTRFTEIRSSLIKAMDNVDHYAVLGLPSGEEGAKLTEKEISKAYKFKALELHPDKRPDDPNAHDNFQKLKSSYEILKDEKARKLFDDLLRIKRDQHQRHTQRDAKRRRMVSDLEEREHAAAFDPDPELKAKQEEERIARKLKEEIERIRAMHKGKGQGAATATAPESSSTGNVGGTGVVLDKSKVLKVSWEKVGEEYTADRLRELFSKFGKVEDVVIKSSKKKGSALVVMSTKEAAFSATGNVCGHLSNPLLVLPLQPVIGTEFPNAQKNVESDRLNNLVGAGFMAYEEKILEKLQKMSTRRNRVGVLEELLVVMWCPIWFGKLMEAV
ncbi:hypothetical protein HS088_TW02G00048 [Tripterygium wilfordii]|uniref:Uncharacterized protein n=1 Tax=Tripterygium wilfordii TaxID=458696 RepID=A0A7J7DXC7_TRIWF|nr:hypothetical protein HS088_TW02G00048 [Tripterygium wilfordii]